MCGQEQFYVYSKIVIVSYGLYHFSDHSLKQFFTNESSVIDILQRVMKVPDNTVEELLTSSININEVSLQIYLVKHDCFEWKVCKGFVPKWLIRFRHFVKVPLVFCQIKQCGHQNLLYFH